MKKEYLQTFCNGYESKQCRVSKVIIANDLYVRGCSIAEHPSLLKHPNFLFGHVLACKVISISITKRLMN